MNNILIYGGLGINIIGALFLMAYAIKYAYAFRKSKNDSIRLNALKTDWAKKRAVGFGLIIFGTLIAMLGCSI